MINNKDGVNYGDEAINKKSIYFQLENWDEVSDIIGKGNMWDINKEFLNQQWKLEKNIYFPHDPWEADGFFEQEVLYLIDLGAKDFIKIDNLWKVVR